MPLSCSNRSVIIICSPLKKSMRVEAGRRIFEMVIDLEYEPVAKIKVDNWRRPFSVDPDDPSSKLGVWIGGRILNIPIQSRGDSIHDC